MAPFKTYPTLVQGTVGCVFFLLFVWACTFLIVCFKRKRRVSAVVRNIFLSVLAFLLYALYQMESSLMLEVNSGFIKYVELLAETPMWMVVFLCVFFGAMLWVWTVYSHRWKENHITDASIKTAIDSLPAGICIFEETGRILLKNNTMEHVYRLLSGKFLLNGCELEKDIRGALAVASDKEKIVITLSDESTWSFVKKDLKDNDENLVEIEAYDVSEEYSKTLLLKEKREALRRLNEQLVTYNKNIISTISAQEVLNAKVKIHDEMGETLLAIKHYLTVNDSLEEKEMILGKLNRNISFLQRETETPTQGEYDLMISTAGTLGVEVAISGVLPQKEPAKHIIATGIHECFTNTFRHAGGDTLKLSIQREAGTLKAVFSNNGKQPEAEVSEKGGLSFLRSLIEQNGGNMKIVSKPEFLLIISLPMEEENGL